MGQSESRRFVVDERRRFKAAQPIPTDWLAAFNANANAEPKAVPANPAAETNPQLRSAFDRLSKFNVFRLEWGQIPKSRSFLSEGFDRAILLAVAVMAAFLMGMIVRGLLER